MASSKKIVFSPYGNIYMKNFFSECDAKIIRNTKEEIVSFCSKKTKYNKSSIKKGGYRLSHCTFIDEISNVHKHEEVKDLYTSKISPTINGVLEKNNVLTSSKLIISPFTKNISYTHQPLWYENPHRKRLSCLFFPEETIIETGTPYLTRLNKKECLWSPITCTSRDLLIFNNNYPYRLVKLNK